MGKHQKIKSSLLKKKRPHKPYEEQIKKFNHRIGVHYPNRFTTNSIVQRLITITHKAKHYIGVDEEFVPARGELSDETIEEGLKLLDVSIIPLPAIVDATIAMFH